MMDSRKECQGKFGKDFEACVAKYEELEKMAREEFDDRMEMLKNKREKVRQKLDEMKNASDNTWGSLKNGVQNAIVDFQKALDESYSRFHK